MIASSIAARALARRKVLPMGIRAMSSLESFEDYGKNVFSGKIADEYLRKQGASGEVLKDPTWVKTHSDVVANAVFDW